MILFISALGACSSNADIYHYTINPPVEWHQSDSLVWNVEITDSLSAYDIFIEIRNASDYKYQNIAIEASIINPNDSLLSKVILNYSLVDSNGKWGGDGWGSLFQNSFCLKNDYRFNSSGEYKFVVRQATSRKKITGINDIGLKISKR